jgi:hypothetical protein
VARQRDSSALRPGDRELHCLPNRSGGNRTAAPGKFCRSRSHRQADLSGWQLPGH